MKFYKRAGYYIYEDGAEKYYLNVNSVNIKELTTTRLVLYLDLIGHANIQKPFNVPEVLDAEGDVYGTTVQDVADAMGLSLDVTLQDQDTPIVIAEFNQVHDSTTLAAAGAINDTSIIVDDATGIVVGSYIILFSPVSVRFMTCRAISIASAPTIDIDTPLDFAYPSGTFADIAITNMAIDGSTTPQLFGLRGTGTPPGIELTVDVTRIIFECLTATAVDLSKFGDIAGGLTKGLVLRKRDGVYNNVFNVKTNGRIEGICFDFTPHDAQNTIQGQHGFTARLTFAGQNKMGAVIRLRLGEDLEFINQDALQTITMLVLTAEGSVVRP